MKTLLILLSLIVLPGLGSKACDCDFLRFEYNAMAKGPREAAKVELDSNQYVFQAQVVKLKNRGNSAVVKVEKVWKGEITSKRVVMLSEKTNCDFLFEPGEVYIISVPFTELKNKKVFVTSICDFTFNVRDKYYQAFVKYLNQLDYK